MEVIGADGEVYEVDVEGGDVMGDVMGVGYAGPMGDYEGGALVGYDAGGYPLVVGAAPPVRRRVVRRSGRAPILVKKPGWRMSQVAPGVIAPDQGMLPLPLPGNAGTNTFTSVINTITFQGTLQKPFRGERLLVSVVRTGASAVGRLMGQLFVGTDLQQADIPPMDIELIGDPAAFGVRLTMKPAQPGVLIRIQTTLSLPLVAPDTIQCNVQLNGRIVQ